MSKARWDLVCSRNCVMGNGVRSASFTRNLHKSDGLRKMDYSHFGVFFKRKYKHDTKRIRKDATKH